MRWFVEVSRVGESGLSEKYCVEAKQWQAALQEARKLRGDSGALSKFSIELLDDGYRAVDPSLKLRYLVNEAPSDTPLTPHEEGAEASSLKVNGKSAPPRASSAPPTSFATSTNADGAKTPSGVPRPASHVPPRPSSNAPPRVSSSAPARPPLVVPHDPVPPAPKTPTGLGFEPAVMPIAPSESPVVASPSLAFQVVRERAEEPRAESPITYREVAYAVAPGATRAQVEELLWARYKEVAASIEERSAGKFVQLAIFDHVFQKRPERAPLATFAWKDWRGEPMLAFPGFGEPAAAPMSQVPPPQPSIPPAATPSIPPVPAMPSNLDLAPMSTPMPVVANAAPNIAPSSPPLATAEPAAAAEPVAPIEAAPPVPAPVIAEPVEAPAVVEAPAPVTPEIPASAPSFELNFESSPIAAARKSSPSTERPSRPRMAVPTRRRAGEDLIGELFEYMHELHFMGDVAAGAEFVLSILNEVMPCEGVLIHVFDINTNHFVVVRAKGPNARDALLQRMSDQDPFVLWVMRSPRAVSSSEAASDSRWQAPRWQALGVAPKFALAGAVRQGGRYLGLIELVNPAGDSAFHPSEANALDYIAEQFAEFLSNRPIIVAADVILPKN